MTQRKIEHQVYYNDHTAPSSALLQSRSALLMSWVNHVENCQDTGSGCGYYIGDATLARVLEHIKSTATDETVLMAHYSLFEGVHKVFNKMLDTQFVMCSSDMIMRGRLEGLPVVVVAQTHYRHAYPQHPWSFSTHPKWIAPWKPEPSACFWRGKELRGMHVKT